MQSQRIRQHSRVRYTETTQGIRVTVEPEYLAWQSSPQNGHYVWAYHIRIKNTGKETVQLVSRHWKITDAKGHTEEVQGPGVVGEQPVIRPNEEISYTSGTYLSTPSGMMWGTYSMLNEQGAPFDIIIPAFPLDMPGEIHVLH